MGSGDDARSVVKDTIDSARMITETTGAIHDFQALQMRRWPYLVFTDIDSCVVEAKIGDPSYDDVKGNLYRKNRAITIIYKCERAPGKKPRGYKQKWAGAVTHLNMWTKELFWPDTEIQVFINNEEIKNEQPKRKTRSGGNAGTGKRTKP